MLLNLADKISGDIESKIRMEVNCELNSRDDEIHALSNRFEILES